MHLDAASHSHLPSHFPPVPVEPEYLIEPHGSFPVLEARELRFRFGSHEVLHDVSFSVEKGRLCGLLGPNGSGKTTLFRCCMGFLKPFAGVILLEKTDSRNMSARALARRIAYVPQEHRQSFPFSVRETVLMGRTPHLRGGVRLSARDQEETDLAMERLGIRHLAEKSCNELSGGQRQLALIARAVAQDAPLLLLDEPTSALDFHNQIMVWTALRALAAEDKTILVCCHDPNHILWFCDQVVALKDGNVLADGNPVEAADNGLLARLFGDACAVSHVEGVPVIHPRFSHHHGKNTVHEARQ